MRVPEHLKHKPIIGVDNYDSHDAMYSNHSDAKALSIGKSQWDEDDISAKVWRHTTGNKDGKWSRQSEEIPLHRVLDLAILITSLYRKNNHPEIKTSLNELVLDENGLEIIKKFLEKNKKYIEPRVRELKQILNEIEL